MSESPFQDMKITCNSYRGSGRACTPSAGWLIKAGLRPHITQKEKQTFLLSVTYYFEKRYVLKANFFPEDSATLLLQIILSTLSFKNQTLRPFVLVSLTSVVNFMK